MPPVISCLTTAYGPFGGEAAIAHIRDAGLEYVEIPIRTEGFASRFGDAPLLSTASTSADMQRVEQLLDGHGVRIASCGCFSGSPLDPSVVEIVQRKLDIASDLGVTFAVGDAGSFDTDAEREQLYAHLCAIGNHAGRRGMTLCFETHRGVCVNHREMLRLMHDLDHPHLRLNFDTANILFYNEHANVEAALAKCCHFVEHVHLKDSLGRFGEWNFPALGAGGAVDFVRVLQIMRNRGFGGPYGIEIDGVAGEPELSLADRHRRVCDSVNYLRHIGYFD